MPRHRNYIHNPEEPSATPTVKGQKGSPGARGVDGRKGDRGPQGIPGVNGHTSTIVGSFSTNSGSNLPKNGTLPVGWDDGANPPTPFTLEVGESLIDTRTGELWCFTPASNITNWTKIGKISGPPGVNGQDGARGHKGDTGAPGIDGNDGVKGVKGNLGPKGEHGALGTKGQKGQRGTPGKDGTNGCNGLKGEKGSQGPSGRPGRNASKGDLGPKGSKGSAGPTGVPGPRGLPGARGQKGNSAPDHLLPRLGATINVFNGGLLDRFNVSKTELIRKGRIRVFFATPQPDTYYTPILTTQSGMVEEDLGTYLTAKTTTYLDIAVKDRKTDEFSDHGIVSLVLFRFHS